MKIVYRDVSEEFCALLQECVKDKNRIAHIAVTPSELNMLLRHKNARHFLGEFISRRDMREVPHQKAITEARQQLEATTDTEEQQRLFNVVSDAEEAIHTIRQEVPKEFTQSGVRIKVVMSA